MKNFTKNHKRSVLALPIFALFAVTTFSLNSCAASGPTPKVDIVYQDISAIGKATIGYVKTRPYKTNLQEGGFPAYLEDGRNRPDNFLDSSFETELNNANVPEEVRNAIQEYGKIGGYRTFYFETPNFTRVIFYIHGGAYFKNMNEKHIVTCYELAQKFNAKVYMPMYPIAPKNDFNDCFRFIDQLYNNIVGLAENKELIIAGDSAGGGLALSYTQFLFNNRKDTRLPDARILFSPWCDLSMSNQEIANKDSVDVFLAPYGLREIGKIWAGSYDVADYKISPLYGEFEDKIPTIIFHGSDEILFPDAELVAQKLTAGGARTRFVIGKGLFHVYPIFLSSPLLPEAQEALDMAYDFVVNKK